MSDLQWLAETVEATMDAPEGEGTFAALAKRFEAFGLHRILLLEVASAQNPLCLSTMTPAWLERYEEQGYARIDPFIQIACPQHEFTWAGREFLPDVDPLSAAQRQFVEEGADAGLHAGFTVPVRTGAPIGDETTGKLGGWVVGGALKQRELRQLWSEQGAAFRIALMTAYMRVTEGLPPSKPHARVLTRRERQCLEGLANGETYKEIAGALNLSYATVEFHVRNARRKLSARTREQAVARSLARCEILVDAFDAE